MIEIKSRSAKVKAVTTTGNYFLEDTERFICNATQIEPIFAGILGVISL